MGFFFFVCQINAHVFLQIGGWRRVASSCSDLRSFFRPRCIAALQHSGKLKHKRISRSQQAQPPMINVTSQASPFLGSTLWWIPQLSLSIKCIDECIYSSDRILEPSVYGSRWLMLGPSLYVVAQRSSADVRLAGSTLVVLFTFQKN